jgi:hypothetical protein
MIAKLTRYQDSEYLQLRLQSLADDLQEVSLPGTAVTAAPHLCHQTEISDGQQHSQGRLYGLVERWCRFDV